ncbi:MAG TPA: DUF1134 domain-containing protein, partial [Allosphingosinicella sp.]|nr:DUF1134 domain-containing protein [Allosphingosinicella sp.]
PALAQVQTIDPNQADAYQSTEAQPSQDTPPETWNAEPAPSSEWAPAEPDSSAEAATTEAEPAATETSAAPAATTASVPRQDVFSAAEGLFGRGAAGLGGILEDILRDQGEPVAYISGQEASGAFVLGVRYGSGTMHHQIEGDRAVYWRGPSVGFDFGADANKVFVLVYNLHDSQRLFRRFPGAEGNAYFVGGFTAQYLRRGDVVLIPIRLGVGMRLGVNAGYMRFSERNRWLPF